jgi:hypothetical protein
MKPTLGAAFAALLVLSITACSSSHKADADATTTSVKSTADPAGPTAAEPSVAQAPEKTTPPAVDDSSNSGEDKPGAGHVSMTGDYVLESDFVVDMCQTGPPGDGLLSGYHMGIKDNDPKIAVLGIALKTYDKDGEYVVPSPSREAAVGQAMTSGTMGPLQLMVMQQGNTTPFGFGQTPSSKLTITVSNNGANGTAVFSDLESQPEMSKFDPQSGRMPAGKRASGSISWTCGTVGRIDPKMNDAVNGAFKKLIPGR